jgi:hypothetical protein
MWKQTFLDLKQAQQQIAVIKSVVCREVANHDYFKKIIPAGLLFSGLILITAQSYADCSVIKCVCPLVRFLPLLCTAENGVQSSQFSAGLSCSGFSLAALNTTYLKYRLIRCQQTISIVSLVNVLRELFGYQQ